MLEAQRDALQKQLDFLNKPPDARPCHLVRVSFDDATKKGFDYPTNTLHVGIDYRDNAVLLIVPVKVAETVKNPQPDSKA